MAIFKSTRHGPQVQGTDIVERPPKTSNVNAQVPAVPEPPLAAPWALNAGETPHVVATPSEMATGARRERKRRADVQPGLAYAPIGKGLLFGFAGIVVRTVITLLMTVMLGVGVMFWGNHIVSRVADGHLAPDSFWAVNVCRGLGYVTVTGWKVDDKMREAKCKGAPEKAPQTQGGR